MFQCFFIPKLGTWKCPNMIHRKERPGEAERLQVLGVEFAWLTNWLFSLGG